MSRNAMMQLDPTIPVVTPDGKGEAIGWIDYSKDDDLLWVVFLQNNGECWIYPNHQVRACPNITTGRMSGVSCKDLSDSLRAPKALPAPEKNGKHSHTLPVVHPLHTILKKTTHQKKSRMAKSVFHKINIL
jgi:hypothetical protein